MPATTGVSAVPVGRPGVELQAGLIPSYLLSETAHKPKGQPLPLLSALFEPDRWIGIPGLFVALRGGESEHDNLLEPYVGYRRHVDRAVSVAGIVYGTKLSGGEKAASYEAKRGGAEIAVDVRLFDPSPWHSVHAQASLSATAVSATGSYCVDVMGVGIDCDGTTYEHVDGKLSGVYPAGTAQLAYDFGRRTGGVFHGVTVAVLGTVGRMPRVRDGRQQMGDTFATAGLTLTVGVGGDD